MGFQLTPRSMTLDDLELLYGRILSEFRVISRVWAHHKNLNADRPVTKVTFHLPPTATHLLGEWTPPSHALVLCSSEALHLFQ